jgi:hypothetical protein
MLSSKALYFACPSEFEDPFEGYLPRTHLEALIGMIAPIARELTKSFQNLPAEQRAVLDAQLTPVELPDPRMALRVAARRFGVNCWHRNETESAAMWKLYGNCLAVQSSEERLRNALTADTIRIDAVRYVDFHNDPLRKVIPTTGFS